MTDEQRIAWAAIQARVRHGLAVDLALEQCRDNDIPVAGVLRHHFGTPGDPRYNRSEDVSAEYGLQPPARPAHAAAEAVRA